MKRGTLVFLLCAGAACGERDEGAIPPDGSTPLIAVHVAHMEEQPGTEGVQFEGRMIYLDPEPVFVDADFRRVEAQPRDSQLILDVQLNPEGSRRFRELTAENIGGSMALVVGSRVVSVPRIVSSIGDGSMQIGVPVASAEQRDELERQIRARWPAGGSEGDPPGRAANGG